LELVTTLAEQFPVNEWPKALIERLLRATKRRMRGLKMTESALITSMGARYMQLDPGDLDVRRMAARALSRQKRAGEALELLERVVKADPHAAGDWVALAMVHHELANLNERDICAARALIISPNIALPQALSRVRAQMIPA
jgi:predicted Zn-dependent protease